MCPRDKCSFLFSSSSVVHVPGVNDIQSSSSTGQNMSQISRQLNQSQVAWTGSRPPFPGQVWMSVRVSPLGAQRGRAFWEVLSSDCSSEDGSGPSWNQPPSQPLAPQEHWPPSGPSESRVPRLRLQQPFLLTAMPWGSGQEKAGQVETPHQE